MKLTPSPFRVVVQATDDNNSAIKDFEFAQSSKERPVIAKVIATGIDVTFCQTGDVVCYTKYSPHEVDVDGVPYFILIEEDILAKLED